MSDNEAKKDYTVDVKVSNWPYRSFKIFKAFAMEYAGDQYWPAIDKLLERSKRLEMYEGALQPDEPEEEQQELDQESTGDKPLFLGRSQEENNNE